MNIKQESDANKCGKCVYQFPSFCRQNPESQRGFGDHTNTKQGFDDSKC